VFAKKIPEIKTAPSKVSLDTKAAFYSGLLPLKLPKFWEVEEQEILESKEDDINLVNEDDTKETDEMDENKEISSYLEYKRKMGKGNNASKI
jgi:hypothetical protein